MTNIEDGSVDGIWRRCMVIRQYDWLQPSWSTQSTWAPRT